MTEKKLDIPEITVAQKDDERSNVLPYKVVEEEISPLANGLPEWNIEPPIIAVRRKARVL